MHEIVAKGILSQNKGMNLYRGCTHGCIYCDSRSTCYGFDHPFEDIGVKVNAPQLLEKALRSMRQKCMIGTGAMCDPYLHLQEKLGLTRRCLQLIDRYGYGVTVQTKSTRVLRDIDLLERINRKTKAVVQMTLTTHDDALCSILQPNVSVTSERVRALCQFRDRGIPTVVWISPILPFINDTEENIRGLLEDCVRAEVKGILNIGIGVTLRQGDREYFYKALDRHFPGMKMRYVRTYGNAYELPSPNEEKLDAMIRDTCRAHGMLYGPEAVFGYLHAFPQQQSQTQLSMFDESGLF